MLTVFVINTLLVSVRLTPLLVASPIAFFVRIPLSVRMLLALALAVVMASALPDRPVQISPAIIGGELLLGVVMAFGFHAAHAALDMLGKLIDTQIGLNAAGVFDPGTATVTGIIAEFLVLAFAMLFVVLNQHHELLRVFSGLLTVVPPGSVSLAVLSVSLAQVMTQQFLLAFMIVVPVIVALWLTDTAFALMARSMPQANVYFLALPVKLGLGVLVLLLSLPLMVQRIPLLFEQALRFSAFPLGAP
ncbi:MAG TPA: flagellar biosynthetic protein FliR [Pseudomonas sp.]|nr:flagellar biosynthetic protein FliR [Pseudomonas sp.]